MKCIGVVSLAAPASHGWPDAGETVEGFVVKGAKVGDIILRLGLNRYPTLSTDFADYVSQELEEAHGIIGVLSDEILRALSEIQLHLIGESYLQSRQGYQRIQELLRACKEIID